MASKQKVCTHDWGSASGISRCAECGALGSYFPGGDRGEPAFRTSVPGSVVARARKGDLDALVAALPALYNGAWALPEADWAALLRSIYKDLDTWRAALSRASGDVAFFDRALALAQLAPANLRVALAKPRVVQPTDLVGRLALEAAGKGFVVLALDDGCRPRETPTHRARS